MRIALAKIFNPVIFKQPKFLYSTVQKKNVFVLPKKQFIHPVQMNAITQYTQRSQSIRELAYLFRDNIKSFTDVHVGALWQHAAIYKLEVDDTMYSLVIPITLEYINTFTRNNATALGAIAMSAASLNIQSTQLWNSIFNKLNNEDIYRYLTLAQTVHLLHTLAVNGKFVKHPLIAKLEAVITKQKSFYDHHPQLLQLIRQSVSILQKNGGQKPLQLTEAYKLVA